MIRKRFAILLFIASGGGGVAVRDATMSGLLGPNGLQSLRDATVIPLTFASLFCHATLEIGRLSTGDSVALRPD
ncbi:secreted protein [Rhodopirellula sallentina SM41]|uniref:Secreted protein n=1 Tax=Rhodopirellula sallentina SM41 TaxID=1263870 RepID=M5UCJ6_9BACT|nr:secreted protein [Rhodopirellula sallentina SM41]